VSAKLGILCATEKAAYEIYNRSAMLVDLSDLGIKRVKKMFS